MPCLPSAGLPKSGYPDHRSGNFIEYLLGRDDVKTVWHEYTHHEFCERMGDGTLPRETFKNYMIQDYLYLVRVQLRQSKSMPDMLC